MLLHSILNILDRQFPQPGSAGAEKKEAPTAKAETVEAFANVVEEAKTPASAATFAAAEEAKGMKRIELEIAAAAGLLRPIHPEPPRQVKRSGQGDQSLEELLRTVEELKKPEESHNLDLFE